MEITDFVIADLAQFLAAREAELVVYREIAQQALAALHDADAQHALTSATVAALRGELRRYVSARVSPCL